MNKLCSAKCNLSLGVAPGHSPGIYKKCKQLVELIAKMTAAASKPAKVVVVALLTAALARLALALYGMERARERVSEWWLRARSKWLEKFSEKIENAVAFRQTWQTSQHVIDVPLRAGHPHPECAADRTGVSRAIDQLGWQCGNPIHTVSLSGRDALDDPGTHLWVCPRDILYAPKDDEVSPRAIIKMIDADYYADMHDWLGRGRPIIAYSFVPREAAYQGPEYSYYIDKHDYVNMEVTGSSVWRHRVWDYDQDYVVTRSGWFTWTISSVDSKSVGGHHRVVCLVPQCKIKYWGWLFWDMSLRRRSYKHGGLIATTFKRGSDKVVSILKDGSQCAVTVSMGTLEAVKIRMEESKKPVISDVERYLVKDKHENAPVAAATLFRALMDGGVVRNATSTHLPPEANRARHYQSVDGLVNEEGKEIGRAVAPAIVQHEDSIPNRSENNDTASIMGRVTKQINRTVPHSRYNAWAADFLRELIPEPYIGVPLSVDEVIEVQDRPTQRARSEQARPWICGEPYMQIRAFMKAESYATVADPRNISTVSTEHTLLLSSYTYAFKRDVLYDKLWYAPGKPPRVVAGRVVDLCQQYERITEGDFSRFDGRVSEWLRTYIEQAAYLRWVGDDYHDQLYKLLKNELNASATTKEGVKYSPLYSRLSGSPLTTDANTLINVFVSYAAAREGGMSHEHAWKFLGVYAGDDSLSPISGPLLEKASEQLGLKFKPETRRVGTPLTFLGRLYVDPFGGSFGSIQDPDRTWRKLHLSFAPESVPDYQALANRAAGFLALDPVAPIVSTWCRLVERCNRDMYGMPVIGEITSDTPYYAQVFGESETWPQAEYTSAVSAIAWRTGLSASEIIVYDETLEHASDLREVAGLIHNEPTPPPKITAAINGEIVGPPEEDRCSQRTEPARLRRPRVPPKTSPNPPKAVRRGAPHENVAAGTRNKVPRPSRGRSAARPASH